MSVILQAIAAQQLLAPEASTATIQTTGTTITVVFSEEITSGSATAGFSSSVVTILSGSYSGTTLTLVIEPMFQGESAGTITYNSGTGSLAGGGGSVPSFSIPVTNNSTQPIAQISATGSGLAVPGITNPRLAPLSATTFALLDVGLSKLIRYTVNVSTGSVTADSGSLTLSQAFNDIAGLDSLNVAIYHWTGSGSSRSIRNYTHNGVSAFAANGSPLSISANTEWTLIPVTSSLVVVAGDTTRGTYEVTSGTPALYTSNTPGTGTGVRVGCKLATDAVAVFSPTGTGGYYLEKWTRSGTTWTKSGNTLTISTPTSGLATSGVCALTSTRVLAYFTGATGGRVLRVYDFDGTTWAQVGRDIPIGSASATDGAVETLDASNFVFCDNVNDTLQVYAIS